MSIQEYISPQIIKKYKSNFNSEIEVVRFHGHTRLDMGNLTQSGWIIEKIWGHTFKKLLPKKFSPKSVLILGLGAGSVAKLVSKKWPTANITGIEIDPVVIEIAREHFDLDKIPNLTVINDDAVAFVSSSTQRSLHYDLTIVDCYQGDQIPSVLQTMTFFKKLKKISSYVLINRIFWGKYKEPAMKFLSKLNQIWQTTTTQTPSNFLISLDS